MQNFYQFLCRSIVNIITSCTPRSNNLSCLEHMLMIYRKLAWYYEKSNILEGKNPNVTQNLFYNHTTCMFLNSHMARCRKNSLIYILQHSRKHSSFCYGQTSSWNYKLFVYFSFKRRYNGNFYWEENTDEYGLHLICGKLRVKNKITG